MKEQIKELLKGTDINLINVMNVNYKPHPFMITRHHITKSSGMYLDPNVHPCGSEGCNLSHAEHTSDKVVILQWKKGTEDDEIDRVLKLIVDEVGEDKFDGFTFIEPE
jgi:hypothetical protein